MSERPVSPPALETLLESELDAIMLDPRRSKDERLDAWVELRDRDRARVKEEVRPSDEG